MRYGCMAGFRQTLPQECAFIAQHFDFAEVTVKRDILKTADVWVPHVQRILAGREVLGHVWDDVTSTEDIVRNCEVVRELGAQKITVHPLRSGTEEDNVHFLLGVAEVTKHHGMILCIENITNPPYNRASVIKRLVDAVPEALLTLDVGHARKSGELEIFLKLFHGRIGHVHLHDNIAMMDHIFFTDRAVFDARIAQLRSADYDGTVLLETFSIVQHGESVSQDFPQLCRMHLSQLKDIVRRQ